VLLDHSWIDEARTAARDQRWTTAVQQGLNGWSKSHDVAQLVRNNVPTIAPRHVRLIDHQPFARYMELTAHFDYFVLTHHGSYNGSIVDMAARGATVLAPRGMARPAHVSLGLVQQVAGAKAAVELIKAGQRMPGRREHMTEMAEVARIMEEEFARRLG
jgi:hypothetical protein